MGARSSEPEVALEALAVRVARWRQTRMSSRAAMPEELWQAAVGLCAHFTTHSVAQYLGLGYDRLRRRCVETQVARPARPASGDPCVQFVEVGRGEHAAGRQEPSAHEVELVRPDGARLILRSRHPLDLRDLARAFLEPAR